MQKGYRTPKIKPGMIQVFYGREDEHESLDICVGWASPATRATANYLNSVVFTKEVKDELIARGYDITTLKFSIEKA